MLGVGCWMLDVGLAFLKGKRGAEEDIFHDMNMGR